MALHPHVREEHPLPAVLMHYVHLISIFVLIITGLFIHNPYANWPMGTVRQVHFWFMYFLIINMVVRVYWAFFGAGDSVHGSRMRRRDYTFFGFERQNRGHFFDVIKYYLYPFLAWVPGSKKWLKVNHPPTSKFNPLQKIVYVAWVPLIIVQALTGFAIYGPTEGALTGFTYALGGPQYMRNYHYLIMWLFILTVAIHVYLSLAEDASAFLLMFFWKETPPQREPAA